MSYAVITSGSSVMTGYASTGTQGNAVVVPIPFSTAATNLGVGNIVANGNISINGTLAQLPNTGNLLSANVMTSLGGLVRPARNLAAISNTASDLTGTATNLTLRLWIPALSNDIFMPLSLVGGLKLTLTLDNAALALSLNRQILQNDKTSGIVDSNASLSYSISNPVYYGMICQPSDALAKQFMDAYNSPEGINYIYDGLQFFQNSDSGSQSSATLSFNSGKRSVTKAMTILQQNKAVSAISGNANVSSYVYPSISQFIDGRASNFQYQIGSQSFPDWQIPIDTFSSQAFQTALDWADIQKDVKFSMRVPPTELQKINQDGDYADAATKLFLAYDFRRDISPLCGVDCSLNPVQLNITFSSAYNVSGSQSNRNFLTWLSHQAVLNLSAGSGVVVRS
jgi:hypothetical protein